MDKASSMLFYEADDGKIKVEVRMEGETVWLSQKQMAALFDKDVRTISEHIKNVFFEQELVESSVIRNFRITAADGKTYDTNLYNLDVIISVGYRVKSFRGTQFRMWATKRLREYLIKGFTLDDDRLKQSGGQGQYFVELLERIRDIRSSERNFYQKITDIYATSIDYKAGDEATRRFFATVQNKMHFAVHGHTAAELIAKRADAKEINMGLTSFQGGYLTSADARVAKNYLTEPELKQLNLIVSLYLDFAELQATNSRAMKMEEWIGKLDDFLRLSEKEILKSAGKISAEIAENMAKDEYAKYRAEENGKMMSDFDKEIKRLAEDK